ncbi:MAG: YlbF family regulator [Phycisphaeraceae bacterium]|nr:YlbF family regulator [Phycisphaeraceae bacterium]
MTATEDILRRAHELGKLIADHEAVRQLNQTLDNLKQDTDAQRALSDFERHVQTLGEKQAAGKPIEVEDKHKLQSLQLAVARNPLLRDLQVQQMNYLDLLRQVDEAMRREYEPEEKL